MGIFLSKKMKYFIKLAESRNMSDAAERLFITRSPLGKIIASLEQDMGGELFYRDRNAVKLTALGVKLYDKLYPIYQKMLSVEGEFITDKVKIEVVFDEGYPTFLKNSVVMSLSSYNIKFTEAMNDVIDFNDNSILLSTEKLVRPGKVLCYERPSTELIAVTKKPKAATEPGTDIIVRCLQNVTENTVFFNELLSQQGRQGSYSAAEILFEYKADEIIRSMEREGTMAIITSKCWDQFPDEKYLKEKIDGAVIADYLYVTDNKKNEKFMKTLAHILSNKNENKILQLRHT